MNAMTPGRTGRRVTVLAVAGLMLALFLVALDQTIVRTALPKIIAELNGFEKYAWVTTAYLLASTSMIPVIGKLGDVYGRKWFIVTGILVFLIGSALCGAASRCWISFSGSPETPSRRPSTKVSSSRW